MEMYIKDNGYKIKLKEKEFILIKMEQNMQEIGNQIDSMDLEFKHGKMVQDIKVSSFKEKNKVRANLLGVTDHHIKVNFN